MRLTRASLCDGLREDEMKLDESREKLKLLLRIALGNLGGYLLVQVKS